MRKWVVIGLLALVAGAIVVAVLTRPKEGSVEWHKAEYRKVMNRFEQKTWTDRCLRLWKKIRQMPPSQITPEEWDALVLKADEHRGALIDCGYLVERTFATTNEVHLLRLALLRSQEHLIPKRNRQYALITGGGGRRLMMVIARPEDIPLWEEAIRKVDRKDLTK